MTITQAELKQLLDYDPDTGVFTWRAGNDRNVKAGDVAGTINNRGYRAIKVKGKVYQAHRLAWLYVHGEWPRVIDHREGNKLDNRISSLKEGSQRENSQNTHKHRNGRLVGCYFHKKSQKWLAQIEINGTLKYLGLYQTELDAHTAYVTALSQIPDYRGDTNYEEIQL